MTQKVMLKSLPKPFHIGQVKIDPPIVLAPMEDVTTLPFRLIAKEIGKVGLVETEFVSAMAAKYNPMRTTQKMSLNPSEHPVSIQIFGGDVETMVNAAIMAEAQGADILDINMGCWVPKVCKTGAGAALLNDPDQARRIVGEIVKAINVPVTVKVRAGFHHHEFTAPSLAKKFQDVGVQAITLHARFAKQGFEGQADWKLLEDLRKAISIPLIGNGDIRNPEDASVMINQTGCDGVMVGRAAIGNPWFLNAVRCHLEGEEMPEEPSFQQRANVALRHLKMTIDQGKNDLEEELGRTLNEEELTRSENRRTASLRGQLPLYFKKFPDVSTLRAAIFQSSSYSEVERCILSYQKEHVL